MTIRSLLIAIVVVWLTSTAAAQLLLLGVGTTPTAGGCTDNLLLENGDDLLLETGGTDCLLLE